MIKTDFKIVPNDEEFQRLAGKKIERVLKSERNREAYETAKKDLIQLVKPIVGWNRFKIKGIEHDHVVLENGTNIGSGPVTKVIAGASEILLAVCNVGMDLDCQIKKYMRDGFMFQGVFLDALGSWAVDSVRKQFCEWVKNELSTKEGLKLSTYLSPGESEWHIKEQRVIFDLLSEETNKTGIRLTESMMMIPLKSLSILMGIGSSPMGREGETNCDFCLMKEKCQYRHLRA
jgi:hypothetical protein